MYLCKECGGTIDEPNVIPEFHPAGDGFVREDFGYCPHCGCAEFETAYPCQRCWEPVADSDYLFHLCKACENEALSGLQEYLDGLDDNQLDYLNWRYDGEAFERSKAE